MSLPTKIKNKIISMVNYHRKSDELQREVEFYIMNKLNLEELDELESIGITDFIIDTNQSGYDADGLVDFIEKALEDNK